jgi:hypothetical protein
MNIYIYVTVRVYIYIIFILKVGIHPFVCLVSACCIVTGTLLRRWKSSIPGVRAELDTLLIANSVRVSNKVHAKDFVSEELRNEFAAFWKKHNHPQAAAATGPTRTQTP